MYNSSFKVLEEVKILAEEWSNGTQDLGEFLSNSDVLSNIKVRIRLHDHCNVFICTCTLQLNPNGENFLFHAVTYSLDHMGSIIIDSILNII